MKFKFYLMILTIIAFIVILPACDSDEMLKDKDGKETEMQDEQKDPDGKRIEESDEKQEESEEQDLGEDLDIEFDISSHVMENLEGNDVEVPGDLEERVLLKFWQTTCPICIDELGEVEQVHQELSEKDDIGVYTVNVMEDTADIQSFMEDEGYNFPVLFDSDGSVSEDYSVMGFPVTYIVDQNLEVLYFQAGPIGADDMISELQEIE